MQQYRFQTERARRLPKGFGVGAPFLICRFCSEPISVLGCRSRSPVDEQQFLCEADGVRMLPVGFRAGVPFLFSSSVRNRFLFGGVGSGAQPMSNSTFAKPIGSECFQKGSGPEPFFIFKFGSEPISFLFLFFARCSFFFSLGAFSDASELGPGIKKFPGGRFFEKLVKYPIGYFAITFVTKNIFFFIKKFSINFSLKKRFQKKSAN